MVEEPVCAKLYEAVQASRAYGGNRQLLQQYLQTAGKAPSHTECCGLLAHALELKPHLGGTHMSTLVAICPCINKLGLLTFLPFDTPALLPHLHKGLLLSRLFTYVS